MKTTYDLVYIAEGVQIDDKGKSIKIHSGSFYINYVRFADKESQDMFLNGVPLQEVNIVCKGGVPAPKGEYSKGTYSKPTGETYEAYRVQQAITNLNNAIVVVKASLRNPQSSVRLAGFSERTPVYVWNYAEKANAITVG